MAQALQTHSLRAVVTGFAAPSPPVAFAIRFAVSVSAAIWIGHASALVTNSSSWILITVLMVAQPDSGGSLVKGLLRAVGTMAAAITAIVLFGLFSQNPPLLLAGLFLVQAVGAYGFSGPRNQYAWFVFAFTTTIILGSAMTGESAVETVAFQRTTMVGLGLLIVFVADSLLWPAHTEASVRAGLATRARALATALREAITTPAGSPKMPPASPLAAQLGQIDAARTEIGVSRARTEILRRVAILLEAVASRVRILQQPIEFDGTPTDADDSLAQARLEFAERVEAAIEEVAAALTAERLLAPFVDKVKEAFLPLQSEFERLREQGATHAAVEGRAANLRDLIAILGTLQNAFDGFVDAATRPRAALTPARIRGWLRPDPFRMQIALRTGIAVSMALLIPMSFGWSVDTIVAPIAFMIAAIPTRGAVLQTLLGLTVVLCFGWLLADLAIVFVGPALDRLPLALVHVVAVAAALGYISTKKPQLAMMRSIGGLLALLTVYGGATAPTDVYGPYNTLCYLALSLAVGWAATHLFWPATATTLFRKRAAAQLELCLSTLQRLAPDTDSAGRRRRATESLQHYTEQLASMASLHAQAEHEPVELGLDGPRRAALLALTQDLFDASLVALGTTAWERGPGPAPSRPELASLREAFVREDESLLASVQSAADALRAGAVAPNSALAETRRDALDRLDALRADTGSAALPDEPDRIAFLEELDSRSRIVNRQLAIESWLADWAAAEAG